ncbi:unnamed protein product [Malus baccata var. baccata]
MCRNPLLLSQLRLHLTVTDGIFLEEPDSGAVATIENKKVSVGTLEWVQSYPFEEVEAHTSQSIVYVGIDSTLAGIDVYMLSGDKSNNAEYVASAVGIPKEKHWLHRMLELPWVVVLELLVRCLLLCYWATDFHRIFDLHNFMRLLDALELSTLTMKTVKQNPDAST